MSKDFDAIVIGGGHNGLVAAATLAQAGRKVLVLERRHALGGAAATEEVFPGFHFNTGADHATLFHDEIVSALNLESHGLQFRESPVALFAPQDDSPPLTLWANGKDNSEHIAAFSQHDAQKFAGFVQQSEQMAAVLRRMMLLVPPDITQRRLGDAMAWGKVGLQVRRLGDRQMMEFMRILPLAVAEYLDDWFESDALKGALGAAGVTGSRLGPRGAGTTLMFLYQNSNGLNRLRFVQGGAGRLSQSLAAAATAHGAMVRTGAAAARVLLNGERAVGVALENGEEITAKVILSSADPRRTFFNLVGPTHLQPRFMRNMRNIIYRGSTARVNLALSRLPTFRGQEEEQQLAGHIRISPSLDYLERAYDDAKYGRVSAEPYLNAVISTLGDPDLAPPGQHVMSVTMQYAPYELRDGDWDTERERLGDLVLDTLARYAPDIKSLVLHRQVLTPADYESEYGLTEGSIFHGQMGLDQLLVMRPVPGWSRYKTPIENLYLCGAGAHPGGGVTGAPGYNAARIVLEE
ncbi:MAG TPA: NAD(P)/FAD-dependent oxidoreductase [Candidatus Sulfomarinibacteraceae bacterium]|nr:NAD(P)/FAD-dependent oxidoreductase [Candidatus Sulfomarinibacteraceae bacterium]